jgi:hypothetical protein
MPKISNDHTRVKLYKLNPESEASGPLIAMQTGHAPGDETFTEGVFLLRHDGKWADFVALGAASQAELWDACLFDKPAQVLQLLNVGQLDAELFPLQIDPEALASWLSRTESLTVQQRIDRLIELYRERLRKPQP